MPHQHFTSTCTHFKKQPCQKAIKSSAGFAVQKFIPPDFCCRADVERVANRAMLLRLLRGEDLTTARSMCGFAACVRQTSYLKKTAMLTLSLSIDSVAASDDRIRTRPWLLMRMSLGPSAPAGMPETEIERAD